MTTTTTAATQERLKAEVEAFGAEGALRVLEEARSNAYAEGRRDGFTAGVNKANLRQELMEKFTAIVIFLGALAVALAIVWGIVWIVRSDKQAWQAQIDACGRGDAIHCAAAVHDHISQESVAAQRRARFLESLYQNQTGKPVPATQAGQ